MAELLGCDYERLQEICEERGTVPGNQLNWTDAASLLLRSWPPVEIEAAVGSDASIPALLRTSTVTWRLPTFLLMALEHLVARERASLPEASRLTVEAFVAYQLEDFTVNENLFLDSAFREALNFPLGDEED